MGNDGQILDDLHAVASHLGDGVDQLMDELCAVFRLAGGHRGDTAGGQVGGEGLVIAQQSVDHIRDHVAQVNAALFGVLGEDLPADISDIWGDDRSGGHGGAVIRRMIMGAEMPWLAVKGRIDTDDGVGDRLAILSEGDIVITAIHDVGGVAVRGEIVGGLEISGTEFSFAAEFRAKVKDELAVKGTRSAREQKLAALCQIGSQLVAELSLGDLHGVGQDQQAVFGEIRLGVENIVEIVALQHDAVGAQILLDALGQGIGADLAEVLGGKQADIGHQFGAFQIFFSLFHFCVGCADELIGGQIELTVGVELIAHGTASATGVGQGGLIAQGVRVLEAAELAPGEVEFARHTQIVTPQGTGVGGGAGEMVVAPAACGQRFQLKVALVLKGDVPPLEDGTAVVVDDGQTGDDPLHGLGHAGGVAVVDHTGVLPSVGVAVGVKSQHLHALDAIGTPTRRHANDVQEQTVKAPLVVGQHFLDLGGELIQIGGTEAETVVAGVGVEIAPISVFVMNEVFGMAMGVLLGKACGDIDLGADAQLLANGQLLAQKITAKVRMREVCLGGMIGPTVVALGKEGDGADVTDGQRLLKILAGEGGADAADVLAGVEVQMDLTVGKGHGGSLLSVMFFILIGEGLPLPYHGKGNGYGLAMVESYQVGTGFFISSYQANTSLA